MNNIPVVIRTAEPNGSQTRAIKMAVNGGLNQDINTPGFIGREEV